MANYAQNGWPVLVPGSTLLFNWTIPASNGTFRLKLRNGSGGFLLAHLALRYSEVYQDVTQPGTPDDWGYAYRDIRGADDWSNHAAGLAVDLNALLHPLGKVRTGIFGKRPVVDALHSDLKSIYRGAIRWGGDYNGRKDEMHFEVVQSLAYTERVARLLMTSPRGKRILAANPTQRRVILS